MTVAGRERDADTVESPPTTTTFPKVTTDDHLRQAAADLLKILQESKRSIPALSHGSKTTNSYVHLEQILKRATVFTIAPKEPRVVITNNTLSETTPSP